ncbi:DsrE family protein [Nocardioides dongkuii]|uniref:DsrE family protein n=1 Tax=Nocardioides dongkuii TaxID=2760089 RepID=UPI0015F96849|nr:DsrE family protein [Nocardioides dongkuii]
MVRPLLVKVTCGADDAERANQGLTVAATALAAGAEVDLWLAGDAVWTAVAGRPDPFLLEHAAAPRDLVAAVRAGGTVTVCSQCAARRGIGEADLDPGVRIAGAAVFVETALRDGVQALVY